MYLNTSVVLKYQELADDLKSELTGDFEEVILGLLMRPVEYDAFCLNKAVKGLGTNEAVLIGILCTANPKVGYTTIFVCFVFGEGGGGGG